MGTDGAVWHIWQEAPNLGWSGWKSLGKPKDRVLSEPTVQENPDGHLEVFCPGDGTFCNRWQEQPDFKTWRHEGWNEKKKPQVGLKWLEAALNSDRRLEHPRVDVIAIGEDGALWHAWQTDDPPHWSPWHSLGRPPAKIREAERLTIGENQDQRLEVFVVGQDGAVWHTWQKS
jgi:hypothetical protein